MTINTLPTSSIIELFLSDDPTEMDFVRDLIEEFTVTNKKWAFFLPSKYTLGDLSSYSFGSREPNNYQKTRKFISDLNADLKVDGNDLVSENLAAVYDEGEQTKEQCRKIHKESGYVSGGAYQFTCKAHGLLLLAKNEDFRQFLRNKIDPVTGKKYYVPFNLDKKNTNLKNYVVKAAINSK